MKANSTLSTLEQELANSKPYVSIDLVIEHQAAIITVQAEIDNYEKLIEVQQQIIAIASQQPDLTSELIAKREELLTDIVLGGNKASALKKLDEQLETIETNQAATLASNSKIIEQANQTIIGLNRRVVSTREKLSYLQSFTPKVLDILLMEQAEQVSIEFNAIASTLIEKLKHLVALESLITQLGQRGDTGLLYDYWRVKIPCVGYEKIPATLHIETHYIIDGNQTAFKSESMDTVNQVRQHLISQGVQLNQIGG